MHNVANTHTLMQPNPSHIPMATPSLRRRMACWMYEGMLMFAVAFMATWLFSTLGQMRNAMDARHPLLQGFLFVTRLASPSPSCVPSPAMR
jgi:hypothetical protein